MFDLGWQEILLIGAVALVVIGPKDLPRAVRAVAGWVRKGRELAREFQSGVDDMVRQADLDDIKTEIAKSKLGAEIEETMAGGGKIAEELGLNEIKAGLEATAKDVAPATPAVTPPPVALTAPAAPPPAVAPSDAVVVPETAPPAPKTIG